MKWSRYNLLFQSKRNGWLLYNSASNSFLQLSEEAAEETKKFQSNPDKNPSEDDPMLYFHLLNGGYLVKDTQDDDFFRILKMRRLTANYAGNTLLLTVAPTRVCNFACPYCYENNRTGSVMEEETENKVVEFVKKQKHIKRLALTWYGGEPLLAFERICSLHGKLKDIGCEICAFLVTNGYCMTEDVIAKLNGMCIQTIQITLDGSRQTHDGRRYLIGGGATYDTILSNIDSLIQSDWKGELQIRVNVDGTNAGDFADVFRMVQKRYGEAFGKRVYVYPGFVHTEEAHPDVNCYFDSYAKGEFLAELYREYGINALSAYPRTRIGGCTMTRRNAYVVGPDGELYKCWNDVGEKDFVVGHVNSFVDWNMPLVAEGMVGASYLEDEKCADCFFFPICDGGCAKMRLLNQRDSGDRDTCSYFKHHLEELLELYYENKQGNGAM